MRTRRRSVPFALALMLAVSRSAVAGGPLVTSTNGGTVGWNTSTPVLYRTDLGGLGSLGNTAAVATVDALFAAWNAVPSAVVAFARSGSTGIDVDATNFGPFLGPYGGATSPRGENAIVFDADGAIFDALYGVGTGVLGFAGPAFLSDGLTTVPVGAPVPPGAKIIEGLAFLNGKWIDGINDPSTGNRELSLDDFEAVFVHEFGHFAGLDHTQIHGQQLPPDADVPGLTLPIETMTPFLYGSAQKTLERDDVVALSVLYPSPTFANATGRITGRVLRSDGAPFSGANVVARNVADDADAVSWVSGATIVPAGAYVLAGLTPGASYRVEVQEVDAYYSAGSRVGPFSPPRVMPGPPEAYNGAAESADPGVDDPSAATPITAAAGVTTTGVDIALGYQRFAVTNVETPHGGALLKPVFADFDADGWMDFVAPQWSYVGNVTRFFRGLGTGSFAAPALIDTFPGNEVAIAGQLNAGVDAFLDVAVSSGTSNEVRVYFGDGTGGFSPGTTILDLPDAGLFSTGLVAGDLNGDGSTDLLTVAIASPGDGATSYALLGSPSGAFSLVATPFGPASGFPRGRLHLAQLTSTPALDVIGYESETALGLLTGDGAGGFTPSLVPTTAFSARIGQAMDVGDFDEDGRTDLAISDMHPVGGPINWTRSFIDVLLGDGSGGFALATRYAVPEPFQYDVVVTDVDGDGHADIASTTAWFAPGQPGAKAFVARGDGAGNVGALDVIWGLAEFPTHLSAADLNADGRTDLFVGSDSAALGLTPNMHYSVLLQEVCGNGATDPPEECDDGNRTHGDGCDGNCRLTGCGNGVVSAGEECDDGNVLDGDGCSPTCTVTALCGDGIPSASEECDDGNLLDGDCCSASCAFEAAGSACGAATDLCLALACDGAGSCQATPRPPRPCRQSIAARTGRLQILKHGDEVKHRLDWRWGKGVATPKSAFGSPAASDDYALCLYGAANQLLLSTRIPAGTPCNPSNPRPCWKENGSGFRYLDPARPAAGVKSLVLVQGLRDGQTKITAFGRGESLDLPALPIAPGALPLRAQLEARNGECWAATYGAFVTRNTAAGFSAKND